jgi:hypothetical protein
LAIYFRFHRNGPNIVTPEKGENIAVDSIKIHQENDVFDNDLALVKLAQKIRLVSMFYLSSFETN